MRHSASLQSAPVALDALSGGAFASECVVGSCLVSLVRQRWAQQTRHIRAQPDDRASPASARATQSGRISVAGCSSRFSLHAALRARVIWEWPQQDSGLAAAETVNWREPSQE